MPQEQSLFSKVSKAIGGAISDVREKFEESVWGRVVNERDATAPQWPEAREPEPSFGSVTREIDVGPTHDQMKGNGNFRLAAMERDLNRPEWPKETGHAQDIGQERERSADRDMDR